jgi:hypothetical protein
MSGLARLRGLKQDGIVSYRFDSRDNTYHVLTPRGELVRALEAMKRGEKDPVKIVAAMRGFKPASQPHPHPRIESGAGSDPLPGGEGEMGITGKMPDADEETPEQRARMLEEIRRFRASLESADAQA